MKLLQLVNETLREGEGHLGRGQIESIPLEGNSRNAHYRVLAWVRAAYEDIQRRHRDYKFHWQTGTLITTSGETTDYSTVGVRNLQPDSILCQKQGETSQTEMCFLDWQEWRDRFLNVADQIGPSTPFWLTRMPDDQFRITPKPISTNVYIISAEWYRTNHQLIKETDESLWEDEFDRLIILEALISYAEQYDVASLKARLGNELPSLRQAFYNRYLP